MAGAKEQFLASYMNVHHKENCNTWRDNVRAFIILFSVILNIPTCNWQRPKCIYMNFDTHFLWQDGVECSLKKGRIKYQHLLSYHLSLLLAHLSNLLHPFFPTMNASRHFWCKKNKSKSTTFKRAFYLKGANFGVCIVKTKTQQ